jgi:betaine-aldehyde dehydrogenase
MSKTIERTTPDTSNLAVTGRFQSFIDGHFVEGRSERVLFNPATGKQLCTVSEADLDQTEEAIRSARRAFDLGPWTKMTAHERAMRMFAIADRIEKQSEELAWLEMLNAGKPIREARYDVSDAVNVFRYYGGLITKPSGQVVDVPAPSLSQVVREPVGVCGQIIPWNYPIQMAAWKLAPALAAGNTCILKPSELTPLTAVRLFEIMHEADLPPGTANLILGSGQIAGNALAASADVDKIAFTGGGVTGRAVARAALGNLKKLTLELGGKSPMIVFDDVDVATAVDYALFAIFCHAGQVCSAGSRFIIHEKIYEQFLSLFIQRAQKIRLGPGWDAQTEMGPLVSAQHRERVLSYVDIGRSEGAKLECGGDCPSGEKFGEGYFMNPTIFSNVHPQMRIVQEEIFGPVAVVEKFNDEAEAISLANGTRFGLAGAVFTHVPDRAFRVAKALRAGVTWINNYHYCATELPFGGYKESGWGRECGTFGLEAYTQVKQINLNLEPVKTQWFAE